ncbi:hypothetical protein, partial [Citrobacter youngae]|uniref:hypothetical protein n=1 Tax=Citrobacter youngae TaxID=133448 RepID=UPI001954EB90
VVRSSIALAMGSGICQPLSYRMLMSHRLCVLLTGAACVLCLLKSGDRDGDEHEAAFLWPPRVSD